MKHRVKATNIPTYRIVQDHLSNSLDKSVLDFCMCEGTYTGYTRVFV